MNLSAKITAIDSKQATGELSKEADKALKSVKAHLDAGSRKEFYDTYRLGEKFWEINYSRN